MATIRAEMDFIPIGTGKSLKARNCRFSVSSISTSFCQRRNCFTSCFSLIFSSRNWVIFPMPSTMIPMARNGTLTTSAMGVKNPAITPRTEFMADISAFPASISTMQATKMIRWVKRPADRRPFLRSVVIFANSFSPNRRQPEHSEAFSFLQDNARYLAQHMSMDHPQ